LGNRAPREPFHLCPASNPVPPVPNGAPGHPRSPIRARRVKKGGSGQRQSRRPPTTTPSIKKAWEERGVTMRGQACSGMRLHNSCRCLLSLSLSRSPPTFPLYVLSRRNAPKLRTEDRGYRGREGCLMSGERGERRERESPTTTTTV